MSRRIICACLGVFCLVATTGAPVMANLITNGGFEDVTSGRFDGWTYTNLAGNPTSDPVAAVSTFPEVIDGTNSARLLYSGAGNLGQTVSATELSDFAIDFDFAVLSSVSTSWDTLGAGGIDSVGTGVCNVSVGYDASGNASLRYHTASGWVDTGLDVSPTTDILGDRAFDDGETPVINHLRLVGRNFGTDDAELTIFLTGGAIDGSFTADGSAGHSLPTNSASAALAGFKFYGIYRELEFLADNVSVSQVPEPSSLALLAVGLFGLAVGTRRKRK